MPNLPRLIDALCEAYDNKAWQPIEDNPATVEDERRTFCNRAVRYVAEKMGYLGFNDSLANEMVDILQASSNWQKIPLAEAQGYANLGNLVVAGIKDYPHGHVVIIRPGEEGFAPKWGCNVPKVMNIGAQNFIGQTREGNHATLNWAFHEIPGIFLFKG